MSSSTGHAHDATKQADEGRVTVSLSVREAEILCKFVKYQNIFEAAYHAQLSHTSVRFFLKIIFEKLDRAGIDAV